MLYFCDLGKLFNSFITTHRLFVQNLNHEFFNLNKVNDETDI